MGKCNKTGHVTALILAAGSGTRMGSEVPKHLIKILGESVIRRTARAFCEADSVDSVIVVCQSEYMDETKKEIEDLSKITAVVEGGKSRMKSASLGFSAIPECADIVAIHDAARCLITPEMINEVTAAARLHGAASAGALVHDTVKSACDGYITSTIDRDGLFLAQTPQAFSVELYRRALGAAGDVDRHTDDNGLIEELGVPIKCVNTGKTNIKLTTPEDLEYAEFLLMKRGAR